MPITEFSGRYRFLSNFFIEPDGSHVEGEYQAHKTNPPTLSLLTASPRQAKAVGQRLRLRTDWEDVKVGLMQEFVLYKFTEHPKLRELLLATGYDKLVEGNWWGDTFWGVCRGRGSNMLGIILMDVRSQLR